METETKRCLFCDQMVPVKEKGTDDWFISCNCSPGGSYGLQQASYDSYNALGYSIKRQLFPLVSAYIREKTDCDEQVRLTFNDFARFEQLSTSPMSVEEKGIKLLQYLFRHSSKPDEPVVIHQLSLSFNLTYSINLQELVYIIEKLKGEEYLERIGSTFWLTEKGWKEAASYSGSRRLKPCLLLIAGDSVPLLDWSEGLIAKLGECGYLPHMVELSDSTGLNEQTMHLIVESKLVIVDASGQGTAACFAAGYAIGLEVPVLWAVHAGETGPMKTPYRPIPSKKFQSLVWDNEAHLMTLLQKQLVT
ncbi:hypothetical protein Back11_21060 [Paenibacillus baekrokdamisoli]|uniref:Uncharacterized protein n=1 Tax=Paenibacillus baekrokdamisoli TaxID=1712516 RepID=A0A3G9J4N1_9BACL|nr:hypothetical protein [Paenibacillus baekrokdamisoli]MBB3069885.1 hypothetical protein [Paenibacillus baekrokdamisoli]BBH20761.1 hypothetical protein Back11_21060 [Paenibacillus baekrokdamisoli]